MTPLSQFHQDYLTMQGVSLMPKSRVISKPVQLRKERFLRDGEI